MNKRVAIVTGVSRLDGIGRAICDELASRDIDIFFTYWSEYDRRMPWGVGVDEPKLIKQEIEERGVRCERLELDLAVEGSIKKLLNEVERTLGTPSILINNATYSSETDINNFSAEELDRHYEINLRATTLLAIEFIKMFKGEKNGRIINLTSGQSLGPMNTEIAYAITKGAIETLTFTLSQEIASRGITINAVNPGPTDTGWIDDTLERELLRRFPMGRIGVPNDISKLIGFLVSKRSRMDYGTNYSFGRRFRKVGL